MAKINVKYKKLVSLFESLTGARSLWEVFNDFISAASCSIQNTCAIGKRFEDNEQTYKTIMERYSGNEQIVFSDILNEIVDMLEANQFQDLLGDLYMQLDMGSSALGQFFTPYSVSQLMAQTSSIEILKDAIDKNGYTTVNEPCCGGGANVIAVCEWLYLNDVNYQKDVIIVCQDLSALTAKMCYIVLSLIGAAAVIKIGDTLSNPYTNYYNELRSGADIWYTPMFMLNNCFGKV